MHVTYNSKAVGDVEVFYREAGPVDAPVILLLHGFPTSSHMFRDLTAACWPISRDRARSPLAMSRGPFRERDLFG